MPLLTAIFSIPGFILGTKGMRRSVFIIRPKCIVSPVFPCQSQCFPHQIPETVGFCTFAPAGPMKKKQQMRWTDLMQPNPDLIPVIFHLTQIYLKSDIMIVIHQIGKRKL